MKYVVLAASVAVQACLGGLYAWTTFVPAVKDSYGFSTAQTQLVFGVLIAVFTLSMVAVGRLVDRRGPRPMLVASGVLFAAGYGLASLSGGSFWLVLTGIGVLGGAATGLGYVCPLTTSVRWFPEHKGLVTGIAVAGFGGGAVVQSYFAELLMGRGTDVLQVFGRLGIVYGAVILAAAVLVRFPPGTGASAPGAAPRMSVPGPSPLFRDPYFWSLFLAMFSGTFAGLLVVGNLKPIALWFGFSPGTAVAAVSLFAAGNALGRIVWGVFIDRFRERMVSVSLAAFAVVLAALWLLPHREPLFLVLVLLAGASFGACFVVYAALAASCYGAEHLGAVYPYIFLSYGIAGIAGPALGGWLHDTSGSYTLALVVSIALLVQGIVAHAVLERTTRNRCCPSDRSAEGMQRR